LKSASPSAPAIDFTAIGDEPVDVVFLLLLTETVAQLNAIAQPDTV